MGLNETKINGSGGITVLLWGLGIALHGDPSASQDSFCGAKLLGVSSATVFSKSGASVGSDSYSLQVAVWTKSEGNRNKKILTRFPRYSLLTSGNSYSNAPQCKTFKSNAPQRKIFKVTQKERKKLVKNSQSNAP